MVRSISHSQEKIIKDIIRLYIPNGIDVDPTYSKGVFYKHDIQPPTHKFDIKPQVEGVVQACATNLPLADASVSSIMFDPPFLATTGKSLKGESGNLINRRFGVFPSEPELHTFYQKALKEFYRICAPKGFLIFKCQDKVSGGKQYFSHCFIYEEARKLGWYPKDLFVLEAKSRIVADWQKRNQQHARKYHSYFWVFQKRRVNICI
jgi:tRNA G10  N-methylase Trm11